MANEVAAFQPGAVPAHIAAFADQLGTNTVTSGITVPSLSPQGKVWSIALNGQKTRLEKKDADGEMVPASVMRVVILDYNQRRGRQFYEGAYDPTKESAPLCWSDDGITPDASSPTLQSTKCETCPKAVKGSKVTEQGKAIAACSQHRMLAVIPAAKLDFEPLRLKIAMTSDWDKQSPDAAANEQKGWFAFQNYLDYIRSSNVPHTAYIVTKMKFDAAAAFPKILFQVDRWLTPEELAQVAPLPKSDKVQKLLGGTWTPAGPDGVRKVETTAGAGEGVAATKAQVATEEAAKPVPAQAATPVVDDDDDDGELVGLDAPAATPAQAPAQAATEVKAPAATPETTPAVTTTKDPALASLLSEWAD